VFLPTELRKGNILRPYPAASDRFIAPAATGLVLFVPDSEDGDGE